MYNNRANASDMLRSAETFQLVFPTLNCRQVSVLPNYHYRLPCHSVSITHVFKLWIFQSLSQWPRGLRRGFAAASLLGLRFRIPKGSWMFVSCECSVLSGRGLCVGLITRPETSYRMWCVWVWSWSLDNEGTLAQYGLLRHGKKWAFQINKVTCTSRVHLHFQVHSQNCEKKTTSFVMSVRLSTWNKDLYLTKRLYSQETR